MIVIIFLKCGTKSGQIFDVTDPNPCIFQHETLHRHTPLVPLMPIDNSNGSSGSSPIIFVCIKALDEGNDLIGGMQVKKTAAIKDSLIIHVKAFTLIDRLDSVTSIKILL